MKTINFKILALILFDIFIFALGFTNIANLEKSVKLSDDFYLKVKNFSFSNQIPEQKYTVQFLDNFEVSNFNALRFYLSYYKVGDSVKVKFADNISEYEQRIILVREYTDFEVNSKILIALIYFLSGIFILFKYNSKNYAYIFHILCIATGIMVLFDRGTIAIYDDRINLIIWFLFDVASYIMPSLFLHFSIVFPIDKSSYHSKLIIPAYTLSATFSITSFYLLYQLFINMNLKYFEVYRVFQNEISDSFLIITLLLTAGILEHSALQIKNPLERRKIYWVLLGITFGALFFVFVFLIPRVILGYELVEQSLMEYAAAIAPLTFLIALLKKK